MKVAICGDGFRAHARSDRGDYCENADILARLIAPSLRRAGCDVDVFASFYSDLKTSACLRATAGLERDVFTWAYRSQVLSSSVGDFYALTFGAYDLIAGFEMPGSLLKYCSEAGIKAIDFAIHPYRFLDDLILMVRSSDPVVEAAIEAVQHDFANDVLVPPIRRDMINSARQVVSRLSESICGSSISLFFMQTRWDRSKFDGNGGVTDDLWLLKRSDVSVHFYKPHPVEARPEIELHLLRMGAQRLPEGLTFYDLMSAAADRVDVVAVSSGVLSEASALGAKSVRRLAPSPWNVAGLDEANAAVDGRSSCRFHPVDLRVLTDSFWTSVIGQSPPIGWPPIRRRSDFLRSAFGHSWDYRMQ